MENNHPGIVTDDHHDQMELPPGFRFHPTDEELITHYLAKKALLDGKFSAAAITDADMNRVEPWELPWKAKMGENEWYFFCIKDKKYPTGQRTNRATSSGYWKATGKDKEIFKGKKLVGMKKTLVFYKGRAPKGVKTNWVAHEYRLEGIYSTDLYKHLKMTNKNDWVVMRVFHKTSGGKKVHISGLTRPNADVVSSSSASLPKIISRTKHGETGTRNVSCFSSSAQDGEDDDFATCFDNPIIISESANLRNDLSWGQFSFRNLLGSISYMEMGCVSQDNNNINFINAAALSNENSSVISNRENGMKCSYEEQEGPSSSSFDQQAQHGDDLDFIWNF